LSTSKPFLKRRGGEKKKGDKSKMKKDIFRKPKNEFPWGYFLLETKSNPDI
jgi:hypothetical protein